MAASRKPTVRPRLYTKWHAADLPSEEEFWCSQFPEYCATPGSCELDGPGIDSRWERHSPHLSRPALGPTQLLHNGYWIYPRGKERTGRDADPSPSSSDVVKKEQSYTSSPPTGRTACTEPQCLYSTAITLTPSVPVQYSYTSTPLSACTVQLYLYSPQYLYSTAVPVLPSVPVQYSCTCTPLSACTVQLYLYSPQCLYSTAIPLLPLWTVRPLQSLSACTRVHFTFFYCFIK